jgi:hypothetical protein
VLAINVTAGGTGYTAVPGVTLSAPQAAGRHAGHGCSHDFWWRSCCCVRSQTQARATQAPQRVTFSSGAAAATAVLQTGTVNSVTLTNAGTGYTSQPTVTISAPPSGTTATAVASYNTFKTGTVSVLVTNGGSGYGACRLVQRELHWWWRFWRCWHSHRKRWSGHCGHYDQSWHGLHQRADCQFFGQVLAQVLPACAWSTADGIVDVATLLAGCGWRQAERCTTRLPAATATSRAYLPVL